MKLNFLLLMFLTLSSAGLCAAEAHDLNAALSEPYKRADMPAVLDLVAKGANPNGEGKLLGGPLYLAIRTNNDRALNALLLAGANPKVHDGGCELLMHAISDSLQVVRLLLAARINPNCVQAGDQARSTPLMATGVEESLREAAQRLVRKGLINVSTSASMFPSHSAAPADIARLLLSAGADPNAQDLLGRNALYYAIDGDDRAVARVLIDGGLNVNAVIDRSPNNEANPLSTGQTALLHALSRYDLTNVQAGRLMIGMLLDKGANPNVGPSGRFIEDCGQGTPPCSFSGETPLSYVARLGYKDFARLLLEHGANPETARTDGAKPADIAVKAGHIQTSVLIARYACKIGAKRVSGTISGI